MFIILYFYIINWYKKQYLNISPSFSVTLMLPLKETRFPLYGHPKENGHTKLKPCYISIPFKVLK